MLFAEGSGGGRGQWGKLHWALPASHSQPPPDEVPFRGGGPSPPPCSVPMETRSEFRRENRLEMSDTGRV